MGKTAIKVIFLAIVGIVFVAGCEEENKIDTKKSRLIATENRRLKKELQQCGEEVERQKKLVEKCLQEKKVLQQRSEKDIQEQVNSVLGAVMEQNAKLREKNEKLKARVQQLETIIQQLGKEPPKIKEPATPQPL